MRRSNVGPALARYRRSPAPGCRALKLGQRPPSNRAVTACSIFIASATAAPDRRSPGCPATGADTHAASHRRAQRTIATARFTAAGARALPKYQSQPASARCRAAAIARPGQRPGSKPRPPRPRCAPPPRDARGASSPTLTRLMASPAATARGERQPAPHATYNVRAVGYRVDGVHQHRQRHGAAASAWALGPGRQRGVLMRPARAILASNQRSDESPCARPCGRETGCASVS